jgi:hypothetical protein
MSVKNISKTWILKELSILDIESHLIENDEYFNLLSLNALNSNNNKSFIDNGSREDCYNQCSNSSEQIIDRRP